MKELKIIVDNRERDLGILEGLAENGADLSFAQLPVGDYIVSDRICIERKTVSDFEKSIIDNRLFDQVSRLTASFEKPLLIIEGEDDFMLSNNVIIGALLKLYTDYNLQVLRSVSKSETVTMISKVAEREQTEEKKMPRLMGVKKASTATQWQVLILSSIPGIGSKLATNLINRFKTIRNIAQAKTEELEEVEKIGKKKAAKIYKVLNSEFSESDTI